MFFVTLNGKAISKHTTFETAEKKRISNSISDRKMLNKYSKNTINQYKVIEAVTGTELFDKYMEQVVFAKEYKEKYNALYQRQNPKGYIEFLAKKEQLEKKWKEGKK